MGDRSRSIQVKYFVNEKEDALISKNVIKYKYKNKSDYLRSVTAYPDKPNYNFDELNMLVKEINKIGVNINQISKDLNVYGQLNKEQFSFLIKNHNDLMSKTRDIYKRISELK